MSTEPLLERAHPVTVELRTSLTREPTVEVTYEGSRPPEALLGALRDVGWEGLVPSPPPAGAIDWTTPDPAAGRDYTVRPHVATTTGRLTGDRDDRATAVERARGVIALWRRLDGSARSTTTDAATSTGEHRPGAGTADLDRLLDGHTPAGPAAPPAERHLRIEVVVDADSADAAIDVVSRYGTLESQRPGAWTTEVTYRGNRNEIRYAVRRIVVQVPVGRRDGLVSALGGMRVRQLEVLDGA